MIAEDERNEAAIGHDQRFANIVIGHQNPNTGTFEIENDALQFQHLNRIDSGKRLIQQQEVRINH